MTRAASELDATTAASLAGAIGRTALATSADRDGATAARGPATARRRGSCRAPDPWARALNGRLGLLGLGRGVLVGRELFFLGDGHCYRNGLGRRLGFGRGHERGCGLGLGHRPMPAARRVLGHVFDNEGSEEAEDESGR